MLSHLSHLLRIGLPVRTLPSSVIMTCLQSTYMCGVGLAISIEYQLVVYIIGASIRLYVRARILASKRQAISDLSVLHELVYSTSQSTHTSQYKYKSYIYSSQYTSYSSSITRTSVQYIMMYDSNIHACMFTTSSYQSTQQYFSVFPCWLLHTRGKGGHKSKAPSSCRCCTLPPCQTRKHLPPTPLTLSLFWLVPLTV